MRTLTGLDIKGKRVVLRTGFDVPVSEGVIEDDSRIRAAIPTIEHLLKNGAAVTIISHLGRPKGKDKKFSLAPVADKLSVLLKKDVQFLELDEAVKSNTDIKPGQVRVIENLRFDPREEKNDPGFAKLLAALGDVFINDAFSVAHRAHASTVGIASLLPSAAGLELEKEVSSLTKIMDKPRKPYLAVIGGAKVSTKIGLLKNLIKKADILAVGGAMANTFLVAQGFEVGRSVYEEEYVDTADEIIRDSHYGGAELILPKDALVSSTLSGNGRNRVVDDLIKVGRSDYIVDLGPDSVAALAEPIAMAGTIVWNGPMGINEIDAFAIGTEEVARMIAKAKAVKIVGGGETLLTVSKLKLEAGFDLVSTGGGAMLDFLEGKELPAIEALS